MVFLIRTVFHCNLYDFGPNIQNDDRSPEVEKSFFFSNGMLYQNGQAGSKMDCHHKTCYKLFLIWDQKSSCFILKSIDLIDMCVCNKYPHLLINLIVKSLHDIYFLKLFICLHVSFCMSKKEQINPTDVDKEQLYMAQFPHNT